jgi:hypothetical protein
MRKHSLAKRTRIEMLRHCYFLLFHAVIVRTVRERVRITRGDGQAIKGRGRNMGNVQLWLHILSRSCAVNTPLTMSEHHSSVPSGHVCASEKPSPPCPGDGFLPCRAVE